MTFISKETGASLKSKRLSNKHKKNLNLAFKVAEDSKMRIKHGAVVVRNGNVVSVATNSLKNDPQFVKDYAPGRSRIHSTHAEVAAIRRAGANAQGASIYVARIMANGTSGLSRPCNYCWQALVNAGVKEVFYTVYER